MTQNEVVYAVRVERLSYADLQVLQVKIGRTNDINRRTRQYKTTHPNIEILDVWHPNPELSTEACEEGIHELAEKYAYERDGELFTFLQDSYENFSNNVGNLLSSKSQRTQSSTTPPNTQTSNPTMGRYVVEFTDGTNTIAEVSGDSQTEVMVKATNYLIDNHDLIEQLTIPWVPGSKKAIINNESTWNKADPVYKKLNNGYFVDTKLSSRGKQREIKRMATKCEIDVNFRGDW